MILSAEYAAVQELASQGRFVESRDLLATRRRSLRHEDALAHDLLSSELAIELGQIEEAQRIAALLVAVKDADPELVGRAHRVMAVARFFWGEFEESLRHLALARSFCQSAKSDLQLAYVDVTHLKMSLGVQPPETVASMLTQVRRSVIRAGAPALMVELRLCVARAEARQHSASEALKHLDAASGLLDVYPNLWLQGVLHLDRSNVHGLLGDLEESFRCAEVAMHCSERSGHLRTHVAAAINLSHILCWRGEFDAARIKINDALRSAGTDLHLRLAAIDSWANLLISTGQYSECRGVFAKASVNEPAGKSGRLHWDELTELFSKARLAQAEERWDDALQDLSKGVQLARQCGDLLWNRRMGYGRAKCLAIVGKTAESVSEIAKTSGLAPDQLESFAQYYGVLAAAERSNPERAEQHLARALRTAGAMANNSLRQDLVRGMGGLSHEITDRSAVLPSPDLDTAVALLELGGHPHILAREAVAVLEGAGCAAKIALVALGANGPRVIETRGWDERGAVAAARKPQRYDVLPLGQYRDEPWQLVVEPRPELEHRCTLVAIRKVIASALTLDRYRREEKQRAALWPAEALDGDPESIWASEQTSEVLKVARRIAPTPLSILLTGETGTGKEMLARAIHRASDRADRILLPFNCTAVPRDMLESQLFGYRKGAFTGADTSFAGVIRSAAGGTLFLDEIADISLDVQPKLLRFLESHEIHPLGEPQPIKVDVRIIAATNAPLEQLVAEGRFREDLFYRLNVVRLTLPPLRERREEIPPLVDYYLRRFSGEMKKGRLTLSDETLEYLLLYAWPGNVRQLSNEVRRMVAMAEAGATLTPALLSPEIQASRRTIPASVSTQPEVRVRIDQPLPAAVQLLEQTMVRNALDLSHGRVEDAARLLGISRKGLFLKRRRWGLHQAS